MTVVNVSVAYAKNRRRYHFTLTHKSPGRKIKVTRIISNLYNLDCTGEANKNTYKRIM
jgi:hypothetical protein